MTAISRTASFRALQGRIGSATYRLNTILVGLEIVASGQGQPAPHKMAVSWAQPPTPKIAREVANQAEIFACTAAITLASDIFDQYLTSLVQEEWLGFSRSTIDVCTKAVTRSKDKGGDYSVAERTEALLGDLHIPATPAISGIDLLSKWRNVVVHGRERIARLSPHHRTQLIAAKAHFDQHYSHLDIQLAISNFESRKTPVPKETTSLIALAQNVGRTIDQASIRRAAGSQNLLEKATDTLLSKYFNNPERTRAAWSELSDLLQGSPARKKDGILKTLQRVGLTEATEAISADLPASYVEKIITSTKEDLAKRFGIKPPSATS